MPDGGGGMRVEAVSEGYRGEGQSIESVVQESELARVGRSRAALCSATLPPAPRGPGVPPARPSLDGTTADQHRQDEGHGSMATPRSQIGAAAAG